MSKTTTTATKPAPKPAVKPADEDAANRKEIIRNIKGPVVERLVGLIPALAAYGDVYTTVMASPDLLHGCLQVFRKNRESFQDLLVDDEGRPVTDDDAPLKCRRSVNQIVGMVVRSGCKAYAEKRWAASSAPQARPAVRAETRSLLEKLAALVSGKWTEAEAPKPAASQADRFYAAIKDHLEHDWQVPLIPYFAELPVKLLHELGSGCTTLHNPEAIAQLADIGRHNMDQARKILSDQMMREMLDTQPLAAKGVAFLGKDRYEFLHSAVYDRMGEKFWDMCTDCDRLEAMEEKNAKDLEQMAEFLHIISAETINRLTDYLPLGHIAVFLRIASQRLGDEKFAEIFGAPGNKKLVKIFCEKTSAYKLDPAKPLEDLESRLPDLFGAYLRAPADFERGL
ncbi:MAG: hypothetical protein M0006_06795 [Magnetospirillum sp.]|nr:hypothetical protein [Magnetospirillum sp.]